MLKKWIGVVSLFLLMLLSVSFGMVVLAEEGQTRTGVRVSEVGVNSYFYVNFTEVGFTEAAIGAGSYAEWILVDGAAAAGAGGNAFKAGNITDCNNPNGFAFYGITNPSEIVFKAGMPIGTKDGSLVTLQEDQVFVRTLSGVYAEVLEEQKTVEVTEIGMDSYFYVNFGETGFAAASITPGALAYWIKADDAAVTGAGGNAFTAGVVAECNNPNGFAFYGIMNPGKVEFKEGMPIGTKDGQVKFLARTQTFVSTGSGYQEEQQQLATVGITEIGMDSYFYVNFDDTDFDTASLAPGSYATWITVDGVAATGAGGNAFAPGLVSECNNANGFAFYGIMNPQEVTFAKGMPVGTKNGVTKYLKKAYTFVLLNGVYVDSECLVAGVESMTGSEGELKIVLDGNYGEGAINEGDLAGFVTINGSPAQYLLGEQTLENGKSVLTLTNTDVEQVDRIILQKGMILADGSSRLKADFIFERNAQGEYTQNSAAITSIAVDEGYLDVSFDALNGTFVPDLAVLSAYIKVDGALLSCDTVTAYDASGNPNGYRFVGGNAASGSSYTFSKGMPVSATGQGLKREYVFTRDADQAYRDHSVTLSAPMQDVSGYFFVDMSEASGAQLQIADGYDKILLNGSVSSVIGGFIHNALNPDGIMLWGVSPVDGTTLTFLRDFSVNGGSVALDRDYIFVYRQDAGWADSNDLQVVSYEKPQDKEVAYGEEHGLPTQIELTLKDGTKVSAAVAYTGTYDKETAGDYTLTGTITLPANVTWGDASATFTVKVTVAEKAEEAVEEKGCNAEIASVGFSVMAGAALIAAAGMVAVKRKKS